MNKVIKAIFFDIDGTLIPYGQMTIPQNTIEVLNKLRQKGIKLFVATGRPPDSIDHVRKLFDFDGYLTANGQCCFSNDRMIFKRFIPSDSVHNLIPYVEEKHISVLFATMDQSYRNEYNTSEYDKDWPIVDLNTIKDKNFIQIMTHISPDEDAEFLAHLPYCKAMRWTDDFADIVPEDGGKEKGIDKIIEYYGISLDEVMAFGDGGNDITMLKHVAYGIAMGNSEQKVKDNADYVTSDADKNGIYEACRHFKIID